jgi:molybdopterin-guanine dinucleotide biosynthesis protein A
MPALYRQTLAPIVCERLASGDRSMQGLLKTARTMALGLPSDWIDPPSINTPEDLARFGAASSD